MDVRAFLVGVDNFLTVTAHAGQPRFDKKDASRTPLQGWVSSGTRCQVFFPGLKITKRLKTQLVVLFVYQYY